MTRGRIVGVACGAQLTRIGGADLKRKSSGDQYLFEIATLALHANWEWPRFVPDCYPDDEVSDLLQVWWADNKDDLPGSMDSELFDSLWRTRK